MSTYRYVGPHDAVDLTGVGQVERGKAFKTDLDLSGRDDFEAVKPTTKKES